ncbi:MAG: hypothetical protein COC15_01585 [Legionellales bacterium]|nr:MAG: hypothetical protein COC15_01585 [Legionellales bacterium]
MSTTRMTAMQYVDARLKEWGNWSNRHLHKLDYASKTLLANLKEYGHMPLTKHKRTPAPEQSNPRAEAIEELIVELAASENNMAKMLRIHYCNNNPVVEKLHILGMSETSFRRSVSDGKNWIAGCLRGDIQYYCC